MLGRLVNAAGVVLFGYATVVQYNDPDPLQWMVVYGAAALFCLLGVLGRAPRLATVTFGVGCGVGAWFSAQASPVDNPMAGFPSWEPLQEETVRETLGLVLVAVWMVALGTHSALRRARGDRTEA